MEAHPAKCQWTVEIVFYIIEYMLPQTHLDDYVNSERVEYKLQFLPAAGSIRLNLKGVGNAPAASVLSYRLPVFTYGGIAGSSPLQVRLLLGYTVRGRLSPDVFPLTVDYYLGDELVCRHTIGYSEALEGRVVKWCNFTLDAEDLVNSIYSEWPGVYVTVIAEASGSTGSHGISIEVAVESLIESSVRVRRLNYYIVDGGLVYTSMVPSDSPLWLRDIRYVDHATTYAIVYQATGQDDVLGIASLTLVFDLYREVPSVCTRGWVGVSNDRTLIAAETSRWGAYIIEYSGSVYEYRADDVDLEAITFRVGYGDGMALDAYRPAYTLTGSLPPGYALNLTGGAVILDSAVGKALDAYRFIDWALGYAVSQRSISSRATASEGVVEFTYEAGVMADLAWALLEPHYHLAFTDGCRVYSKERSLRATYHGSELGVINQEDWGVIDRSVGVAGG